MGLEPSGCPFCRSHDVRTLFRDDDLASYRCHDCAHTFHVAADRGTREPRNRVEEPEARAPRVRSGPLGRRS